MPTLIDLPGKQGAVADAYVESAIKFGRRALAQLAAEAVARYLKAGPANFISTWRLFNNEEIRKLVQVFAAVIGTADLLGRSDIRQQWAATKAAHGELPRVSEAATTRLNNVFRSWLREDSHVAPMPPDDAIAYFRGLTPALGVDPQRFGDDLRRRVFTMAVATDQGLLRRVQGVIADRMQTGVGYSTAAADIDDVLAAAGVAPKNQAYSDSVMRTNVVDSMNQSRQQELDATADTFPVWEYVNPVDHRSRPEHAARNGRYYPSSVPFTEVRGTEAKDVISCRCSFAPITKWKWARLKAAGARIADGYPDVPSMDELPAQPSVPAPEPIRRRQQDDEPLPLPTRARPGPRPVPQPAVAQVTTAPSQRTNTLGTSVADELGDVQRRGLALDQPVEGNVDVARRAIAQLGDNLQRFSQAEIAAHVQAVVGSLKASEAKELVGMATGKADAIARLTRELGNRKESLERTAGIGAGPAPPPIQRPAQTAEVVPLQWTDGARVQLIMAGDAVRVSPFSTGFSEAVVKQGESYMGWTWAELRAMGDGYFRLKQK